MTNDDFNTTIDIIFQKVTERLPKLVEDLKGLLSKKGANYSPTMDVLGNFRAVSALVESPVQKVILNQIGIKVFRMVTLCSGAESFFESKLDTVIDLIGYSLLLNGAIQEEGADLSDKKGPFERILNTAELQYSNTKGVLNRIVELRQMGLYVLINKYADEVYALTNNPIIESFIINGFRIEFFIKEFLQEKRSQWNELLLNDAEKAPNVIYMGLVELVPYNLIENILNKELKLCQPTGYKGICYQNYNTGKHDMLYPDESFKSLSNKSWCLIQKL